MAPNMRRGRISLQTSLDRDVSAILEKLESANDDKRFKTISQAYDAIKKSNSSLARRPKQQLEPAIDRVLLFRKQEEEDEDEEFDSDAAIEAAEAEAHGEDRFLLNRQLVKHWNVPTAKAVSEESRPAKKRRVRENADEDEQAISDSKAAKFANGTATPDASATAKATTQKKTQKVSKFEVEERSDHCKLGGVKEIFQHLLDKVGLTLKSTQLFGVNGYQKRSGLLLAGPRGSGKASMVRNLAAELELPIISINRCFQDPERLEKALVDALDEATRLAPCFVFIQNVDCHMPKTDGSASSDAQRRTTSSFVDQMKKLRKEQSPDRHVFTVATTSNIENIDPAILRLGIFDQVVHVKAPDLAMRADILNVILEKVTLSNDIDIMHLAKLTHGYVGEDLVSMMVEAELLAAKRVLDNTENQLRSAQRYLIPPQANPVFLSDFQTAIKHFTPSLRKEGFTTIPDVTWDSVGALKATKERLQMSIIGPIQRPELYQKFGINQPAGVLLWGPPGCGKTLVAQAVANAAQASFILVSGPQLLNKYVGESERAVRELFQRARSSAPCIIFFDEFDSIVPRRESTGTETGTRIVNTLLTELDGPANRNGVYVVGTTNRPDMIDTAILRPGRLSELLFVDLPNAEERVDILKTLCRTAFSPPQDITPQEQTLLEKIATDKRCENFSGADLKGLRIKASQRALTRYLSDNETGSMDITAEDWEDALANTRTSVRDPKKYRNLAKTLGCRVA